MLPYPCVLPLQGFLEIAAWNHLSLGNNDNMLKPSKVHWRAGFSLRQTAFAKIHPKALGDGSLRKPLATQTRGLEFTSPEQGEATDSEVVLDASGYQGGFRSPFQHNPLFLWSSILDFSFAETEIPDLQSRLASSEFKGEA